MVGFILAKKILSLFIIMVMGAVLVRAKVIRAEDSRSIDHIPVSDHALCHIFSFSDDLHAADFKKSYIGGGDGAHFTYDHDSSDEASGKAAVIGCG